MGEVVVARGDIWWLERPDSSGRPALVVTRDLAIPALTRVVIAGITRTERHAPSFLPLGPDEGLLTECYANFDDLETVPKSWLVRQMGTLGPRMHELCDVLNTMSGC